MSEKRFEVDIDHLLLVWDTEKNKRLEIEDIVGVLNEQQKEINDLNQENADCLGDNIRSLDEFEKCTNKLKAKILQLQEENEQLKEEIRAYPINEQYAEEIMQQNQKLRIERNNLQRENEQLRKIGVMFQGHNPCEICKYSLENKVCCAVPNPISCDDAKKNFVQGLCKNHKQFQKSFRRYDDE